ncbi:putative spermidine/putrescine transport system permease protein [Octadecabacter temperatus]|uniref:Spermidine/putrescine transport system permease protein PotB n=1 Tax=Octadecabacter temperatus TaxID=1458307 RepID=A0A0K0Y7N8_9RHOB|nr:ABC transporter permease [Octadecabacter temperatus]AKS46930.1 Spermidine/putrescine transport system permease protein PotB [Octadecabacter temperatus]SIO23825.1 putative spermidine/putrescine transport system permease protein [Octadecabacter temperatus]
MTDATSGPVLAADGRPLKASLNRALRRQKLRALMLIAPLLIFILVSFVMPIADMLFRSVENQIVSETLPRTATLLPDWDGEGAPDDIVFEALARDLAVAVEAKAHTRLGSRLNYEQTGISSLFRKTGRGVDEIGETPQDILEDTNDIWGERDTFGMLIGTPDWIDAINEWDGQDALTREAAPTFDANGDFASAFPGTTSLYASYVAQTISEDDNPLGERPWPILFHVLAQELPDGSLDAGASDGRSQILNEAAGALAGVTLDDPKAMFLDIDEDWGDADVWTTIQTYAPAYTNGYFLNSIDMQKGLDGPEWRPENEQIYIVLFIRTMIMSLSIMGMCVLLGYPIAWLLANLPDRKANMLMILVLLPFWTSLLVRTSAWKVLLQQQGVINDTLVWYHSTAVGKFLDPVFNTLLNAFYAIANALTWVWNLFNNIWGGADAIYFAWAAQGFERLALINNQTGTVIAMTHILLPFMILPLYSVMKTIPPSYLRAAKSLGATNWTAFWRVYFPQSVPGIGAGCILVFILSIGYYITPELVGGTKGVFISNRIAYHISSSLNWGLAAALGTILLAVVMMLYWMYDKIVGIDNVKLGG